jgi:hypothetical protein
MLVAKAAPDVIPQVVLPHNLHDLAPPCLPHEGFRAEHGVARNQLIAVLPHSPGWWVMRGAPGGWRLLHVAEWFHSGLARPWGGGRTYSGVRGFSSGEGRARTEEGPMMDLQYFQLRAQVFKAYRQALRLTRNAPADAKGAIHPPAPFFFEERYSSNPHPHPIW